MRRTRPKKPPRSFEPVSLQSFPSQPSPQERVPGRKRRLQRAAKRHPKTTFKSRFRFLFVPILRPFHVPVLRIPSGCWNDIQHPRSMRRLPVVSPFDFSVVRTTTATRPAWLSHRFARALQSYLSRIRFHRMTIAQRTTLSNQLRICRIPQHSRCRGRLQRHVCSRPPNVFPSR